MSFSTKLQPKATKYAGDVPNTKADVRHLYSQKAVSLYHEVTFHTIIMKYITDCDLVTLVKRNRGQCLVDYGFLYNKVKNASVDGRLRWRCNKYREGCKAFLYTKDRYIISRSVEEHDHVSQLDGL